MTKTTWLVAIGLLIATAAFGQQTGTLTGTVEGPEGDELPGVTVTASSNVLPQPRTTVTDARGQYRLPLLPPGIYDVRFAVEGLEPANRQTEVLLSRRPGST